MKKISIFLLLLSQIVNAQNKVTLTGGSGVGGGVSVVSVTTGNGFTGSVLNSTSTPAITMGTNQTGLLYGNGTNATGTKLSNNFSRINDSLFMTRIANVLDYGAVGDGTTNNTTAFQDALNTGYPVFVPAGTYLLSTQVTMTANQILYGADWNSIIKVTANVRGVVLDSGCRVTGLKFVGAGKAAAGTANTGILATAAVGWTIDWCMFQDFAGNPTQNGGGGVCVAALHSSNSDGGRISNNYFYNNDAGLCFNNRGEYVTVVGNNFGANTVAVLMGAGNLNINGNIIQNNTTGIKCIDGTNPHHSLVVNNNINHNAHPYWIEDVPHIIGMTFANNFVFYGAPKIIRSHNIRFNNESWTSFDSIHLDNSTFLSRTNCWYGLTQANSQIPVNKYNGAEDFTILGEMRYANDSITTWIKQMSYTDTAFNLRGPMKHSGYTTASSSSSDSVWVKGTGGVFKLRAQSDISGGGGANTALSNLASVLVNADLDPGSNNSRDIGDGTTSWKDIYAYSFNVRNGSGSGLHTSYTNYSGTPSNGLPPSTGFFVNRVSTGEASSATPTPTGDGLTNFYQLTALATNATFQTPSGSVIGEHNLLWIIIEDNGTIRTLSFNGSYVAGSDLPLPTATVAGESMELQFRCHGGTIWRLVGRTGGF